MSATAAPAAHAASRCWISGHIWPCSRRITNTGIARPALTSGGNRTASSMYTCSRSSFSAATRAGSPPVPSTMPSTPSSMCRCWAASSPLTGSVSIFRPLRFRIVLLYAAHPARLPSQATSAQAIRGMARQLPPPTLLTPRALGEMLRQFAVVFRRGWRAGHDDQDGALVGMDASRFTSLGVQHGAGARVGQFFLARHERGFAFDDHHRQVAVRVVHRDGLASLEANDLHVAVFGAGERDRGEVPGPKLRQCTDRFNQHACLRWSMRQCGRDRAASYAAAADIQAGAAGRGAASYGPVTGAMTGISASVTHRAKLS